MEAPKAEARKIEAEIEEFTSLLSTGISLLTFFGC